MDIPPLKRNGLQALAVPLCACAAGLIAQLLSFALWVRPVGTTALWFPGALALAFMAALPRRRWPVVLVALGVGGTLAFQLRDGLSVQAAYGYAGLVAMLLPTGVMLRFPLRGERLFVQMGDLFRYYLVAVLLFPMAGTAWAVYIILSTKHRLELFAEIWFLSVPCFAAAAAMVAPLLIEGRSFLRLDRAQAGREVQWTVLFCAANLLLAAFLWNTLPDSTNRLPALAFSPIPLLVLSVFRLAPFGICATFVVSMTPATVAAIHMDLPNRSDIGLVNTQILQWSIIAVGFVIQTLSLMVQSSRSAQARLAETAALAIRRQEEERASVSRELHDSIGQRIALAAFTLGNLPAHAADGSTQSIEDVRSNLLDVLDEVRTISRQLHPSAISQAGLPAALEALAGEIGRHWHGRVELDLAPIDTVPGEDVALHLFRIAQEAARNAIEHGQPATLLFRLGEDRSGLYLEVGDDGRGFDTASANPDAGLGLLNMRERCRHIGAALDIISDDSAGGTRICVRLERLA
ncbi:sensor histidine kinase [Pseudoxanthomonas daejeonensis]|uniref:Histidine kinase/HSP90-like ATPase domain-containing protein n=1 Tax=Pseudoxanthomonas daejeonensis TaxID=266062 RepID=A0ABQ6Z456_9GAMM|nr:sensor histidine kinase [Pseudoxanthomonas daejeonensis]KAF1692396.1 hypothetical protein CSC65_14275 [Pseudoxanthomonas daejeonensis]